MSPFHFAAAVWLLAALFGTLASSARGQTLNFTNSNNRDWNSAGNWTPAVVPNSIDAAAVINRLSGSGNRTINANGGPFTVGSLAWTIDPNQNDSLRNGQLLFQSASGVSTLTFTGNSGGNLQIRNGASLAVGAGQVLRIDNASPDASSRLNFTTDGAGGTIAGAGTMVYNDISGLDGNLLRAIRFQQENAGFSGTFRLDSGTLEIHTSGDVFGSGTLQINGGRIVTDANRTYTGAAVISGNFVFDGTNRLTLGDASTTTLAAGLHRIDVRNEDERLQFQGGLTGPGGFVKDGPGELRFTQDAKTYMGETVINAGRLQISEPGQMTNTSSVRINGGELYLASAGDRSYRLGPGTITLAGGTLRQQADGLEADVATLANDVRVLGNSRIDARGDSTLVLEGLLTGSGNLQKGAGGIVALTRANPFSGNVAVTNGQLRLDHVGALARAGTVRAETGGTIQLNVRGAVEWQIGSGVIVLDGGRLRQSSGSSEDVAFIDQNIRLTSNGGTVSAQGDSRMFVRGDIIGPGDLTKGGGGELRFLGGEKSYTGETNVVNGRLRIDDDGVPVATTAINLGGVGDTGNLRFGQRRVRTFSLGRGGRAPIRFVNDGGSIEYTDEFGAVLTNPVEVGTQGNLRSREEGSVFEFTGRISGPGDLDINRGSGGNPRQLGTVYLTGDASGLSGNVDVYQSILRLGRSTTLGANQFNLRRGATYAPEIASADQYSRIASNGASLAAGSRIVPVFVGGLPGGTTRLDLITGPTVDSGTIVADTALVNFRKQSGPLGFSLLANVDYRGRDLGLNRIQSAVGDYLQTTEGSAALSAVQGYALNLPTGQEIANFYDAVAAEEVAGMMDSVLFSAQDRLRRLVRASPQVQSQLGLRDALGVAPMAPMAPGGARGGKEDLGAKSPFADSSDPGWKAFTDVYSQRGWRAREFELGGFREVNSSFVFGADREVSDGFGVGFFGSYERARIDFDRGRGWANSDTVGYGAIATWMLDGATIAAAVQHQHHSFAMERHSDLGTARSRPEGDQLGLFLEGSAQLGSGDLSIVPSAFVQYNHLWIDGFRETGAPISQQFGRLSADSLLAGVGLRGGYTIRGNVAALRPEVFVEYRHELLDADRSIASTFPGASGTLRFDTPGRNPGFFATGVGINAAFSDNTSAYVQYEAQLIEGQTRNYGIFGGFQWHFDENPLFKNPDLVFLEEDRSFRDGLRGTAIGNAIEAINLRGLVMVQHDHAETRSEPGADPDPRSPESADNWFVRRARLSADRDLPLGFNLATGFQFTGKDEDFSDLQLFNLELGWDLFEPFTLKAGLARVPLGWEDTTSSMILKTIERSAAMRAFGRLGGDDIGRFHWLTSASGRFRELYTSHTGPVQRYDFHYEFALANPREGHDVIWRNDPTGLPRWPKPSVYLRLHNELRTEWGTFDFGSDFADIPTFRARSTNEITGATAFSPFLNYNRGWFNMMAMWTEAKYRRDEDNGGELRRPTGLTLTPSVFLTPKLELVGMYSFFDTDGDFAVRLNQVARNVPTAYPDNRRFDEVQQYYVGLNHYIRGDDLKVMYGVENSRASGTREDRPVSAEEAWAFRMRVQMRY